MTKATPKTIGEFIAVLCANGFNPPRHETERDEMAWSEGVASALRYYDDDLVPRIAQAIIDTRTDRRFPLASEIRKTATHVADDARARLPVDIAPSGKGMAWTRERRRLAYDLVRTERGREAANGGWITELWDFCRREMRLPDPREAGVLRDRADETYRDVENWLRDADPRREDTITAARCGNTILNRRRALSDWVLHGVFPDGEEATFEGGRR